MMTNEEREAFVRLAVERMSEHVFPCLTQVIGAVDQQTGDFRGTGFFCEIGGRRGIVTAAHVITEAIKTDEYLGIVFSRGGENAPEAVEGEIHLFKDSDLAFYVPARPFPLPPSNRFWRSEDIERDPNSILRDYLFIQGFPQRFSRFTAFEGRGLISEALSYGAMVRYRERDVPDFERREFDRDLPGYDFLPDDFLQPHEFAMRFECDPSFILGENSTETRKADWMEVFERSAGAHGLSGSPVFRIGASGRKVGEWSPELSRLIGVVTKWDTEQKILIATSTAKMLEEVEAHLSRSTDE